MQMGYLFFIIEQVIHFKSVQVSPFFSYVDAVLVPVWFGTVP